MQDLLAVAPTDASGQAAAEVDSEERCHVQSATVEKGATASQSAVATLSAVFEPVIACSSVAGQASVDPWRCSLHCCAAGTTSGPSDSAAVGRHIADSFVESRSGYWIDPTTAAHYQQAETDSSGTVSSRLASLNWELAAANSDSTLELAETAPELAETAPELTETGSELTGSLDDLPWAPVAVREQVVRVDLKSVVECAY